MNAKLLIMLSVFGTLMLIGSISARSLKNTNEIQNNNQEGQEIEENEENEAQELENEELEIEDDQYENVTCPFLNSLNTTASLLVESLSQAIRNANLTGFSSSNIIIAFASHGASIHINKGQEVHVAGNGTHFKVAAQVNAAQLNEAHLVANSDLNNNQTESQYTIVSNAGNDQANYTAAATTEVPHEETVTNVEEFVPEEQVATEVEQEAEVGAEGQEQEAQN
jgi:hypothetical protein